MGLTMTSARMLRFFTISSRSPVRFPKPVGNANWPGGEPVVAAFSLGTSAGDDSCFALCSWTVEVCFFPQPAITSHTGDSKTNNVRNGVKQLRLSTSGLDARKLLACSLDR